MTAVHAVNGSHPRCTSFDVLLRAVLQSVEISEECATPGCATVYSER